MADPPLVGVGGGGGGVGGVRPVLLRREGSPNR